MTTSKIEPGTSHIKESSEDESRTLRTSHTSDIPERFDTKLTLAQ